MRRTLSATLAFAVLLAVVPAPAFGQNAQRPDEAGVSLTLARCLETALENNLDLVIARKDPRIKEESIRVQDASFDPLLGANANYRKTTLATTTTQTSPTSASESSTTDQKNPSLDLTWFHLLSFGGTYNVILNATRVNQAPRRTFNPQTSLFTEFQFETDSRSADISYTMPLLRNFGKEVNTVGILLAKGNLTLSQNDLKLSAVATIKEVEDAYWDLVAARAALNVAKQSLRLAQDLYELNKKKVEVGTLAPIEITQAEAGVASREEGVIVAANLVDNVQDNLLRLLAVPKDDPMWRGRLVPTDTPSNEQPSLDLDSTLSKALDVRPEILNARQTLRDLELSERVSQNGVRHRLDLNVGLTSSTDGTDSTSRIGGLAVPQPPQVVNQSNRGGPDWRIGLTYGYPLFNRQGKANYAIATLNRERAEVALQKEEQSIRVDVRTAVRNVEAGAKRVQAAESSTILQRKKLEAEQKKFDNGMSTSFEVLTFQNDLADAEVAEIRAKLDYTKALADLDRARGTLLEARNLSLDKAGSGGGASHGNE